MLFIYQPIYWKILNINTNEILNTKCPRSLDPIYILNYNMKLVKTSWTLSTGYFKIIHSKLTDKFTTHWRVLWLHFFYIMKNVKKLLKTDYLPTNSARSTSSTCLSTFTTKSDPIGSNLATLQIMATYYDSCLFKVQFTYSFNLWCPSTSIKNLQWLFV